MMNAFNLKDARAGDYIKKMVAGGPPSLYSPSIDAIFDVIGEMRAVAVVHCDHDTPYNLALLNDPAARAMVFKGSVPKPQYLEAFKAFLKRHANVPIIWAHFMGNGRGVQPYPEHWKYLDEMLGDPGFKHVSIDMAWGLIAVPYFIDTPEHLKMTADLIRKYPDRFIYGSDQGATADWGLVKKSYDAWTPIWKEIGPELTRRVAKDNYIRIFDESRRNMRAWERAHPEEVE
jgi:hypothetical protein